MVGSTKPLKVKLLAGMWEEPREARTFFGELTRSEVRKGTKSFSVPLFSKAFCFSNLCEPCLDRATKDSTFGPLDLFPCFARLKVQSLGLGLQQWLLVSGSVFSWSPIFGGWFPCRAFPSKAAKRGFPQKKDEPQEG